MSSEYLLNRLIENNQPYVPEIPRTEWDDIYHEYDTKSKLRSMGRLHITDQEADQIFARAMAFLTNTESLLYKEAQTNPTKQEEMMAMAKDYILKYPEMHQYPDTDVPAMLKRLHNALFEGYVLQPLINHPDISDIKVTAPNDIRVRIGGKAWISNAEFLNGQDMVNFIKSIGLRNGKDITQRPFTRFVDKFDKNYRLRFSITMPRILQGAYPVMHIRKIPKKKPGIEELMRRGMLTPILWEYLKDKAKTAHGICIGGPPGCVDCETEFFNGTEWKSIADYIEGEQVLQFNPEPNEASLIFPLRYIKEPCDKMYHFETKYGIDQTLSPEHRVLYYKKRKKNGKKYWSSEVCEISAEELKTIQNAGKFYGGFKTDFIYNGSGINLSDGEIKLMLAVICDGTFNCDNLENTHCIIKVKKERKKNALLEIFNELNLSYFRTDTSDGYSRFSFYAPRREKEFSEDWYNCTQAQLQLICKNILQWDGSIDKEGRRSFENTSKKTVDFIQFAFSACGYRATFYSSTRKGLLYQTAGKTYTRKNDSYSVIISDNTIVGMAWHNDGRDNNTVLTEVYPSDGFKYCFTVPTHALVLRRNGKIFVTGNSGKTTLLNELIEVAPKGDESLCIQENDELFTDQRGWIFKTPDITYDDNGVPHGVTMEALGQMALVEGCNHFIIGEAKGGEMRDGAALLNTGCKLWLTAHMNSERDALPRLADMVCMGSNFSIETAKAMVSGIDVIVYMDGYKIRGILENRGYNRNLDDYDYVPIYKFEE